MKFGKTLNYLHVRPTLLNLPEKKWHLCWKFWLVFHSCLPGFLCPPLMFLTTKRPSYLLRYSRWLVLFALLALTSELMSRKSANTYWRNSSGLQRRWGASVARPSIPHLYILTCNILPLDTYSFDYQLATWSRAQMLLVPLWMRSAFQFVRRGQFGCSRSVAMISFRLRVEFFMLRTALIIAFRSVGTQAELVCMWDNSLGLPAVHPVLYTRL